MKLENGFRSFEVQGKQVSAYFSSPAAAQGTLSGIVVIQEAWGVDDHIQDVADRFAAAGYAVVAPELFSHGGKPEPLSFDRVDEAKKFLDTLPQPAWFDAALRSQSLVKLPESRRAKVEETLSLLLPPQRPIPLYLAIIRAAADELAAGKSRERPIGTIGFCMGGMLSLLSAAQIPELGAAVSFYGATPNREVVSKIRCPVLALFAEQDPRVNAGLPQFVSDMRETGRSLEHRIYPRSRHAFFNDTRMNYDVHAARMAWAHTLRFFADNLRVS